MGFFSDNFTFQPGLFHGGFDDGFDDGPSFQDMLLNASIDATNARGGFKEDVMLARRRREEAMNMSNPATVFEEVDSPNPVDEVINDTPLIESPLDTQEEVFAPEAAPFVEQTRVKQLGQSYFNGRGRFNNNPRPNQRQQSRSNWGWAGWSNDQRDYYLRNKYGDDF